MYGPSLVELAMAGGLGDRLAGADRFSLAAIDVPGAADVGGYLDPSLETLASLSPTSIHSVGRNPDLADLASALGIPYHSYSFDRLTDVFAAMDTLERLYGCSFDSLREGLAATLDSIRLSVPRGAGIAVVIWHMPGDASCTLAGRGTWIGDLVALMGLALAAPEGAGYPSVSLEGMILLSPDYIFCAYPGQGADSARITESEKEFWGGFGFSPESVDCAFGEYLLVPGARLGATARRIASCVR